jgi:hypothetical protein
MAGIRTLFWSVTHFRGSTKCVTRLGWWLGLANLHKRELAHVTDLSSADKGFADKVKKVEGPAPEAVRILLGGNVALHRSLIRVGNDPDKVTWGLAGSRTRCSLNWRACPSHANRVAMSWLPIGRGLLLPWNYRSSPRA